MCDTVNQVAGADLLHHAKYRPIFSWRFFSNVWRDLLLYFLRSFLRPFYNPNLFFSQIRRVFFLGWAVRV